MCFLRSPMNFRKSSYKRLVPKFTWVCRRTVRGCRKGWLANAWLNNLLFYAVRGFKPGVPPEQISGFRKTLNFPGFSQDFPGIFPGFPGSHRFWFWRNNVVFWEIPQNQKKSKNPSKIKKYHPPTIQNQRITSPQPAKKREGTPGAPRGPNPLLLAG